LLPFREFVTTSAGRVATFADIVEVFDEDFAGADPALVI
jgi:hypothetical protein